MNHPHGKECLWIIFLALLVLTAIVASATSLEPMSFQTLVQRATMIARMRCVSVHSYWENGEIWTESQFAVLEEEKSDAFGSDQLITLSTKNAGATPSVALRQLGGRIDGMQSHVDGVPEFRPGEEVVLFLWRRRQGESYRVLGWVQGTFRVARDRATGAGRVTQDSSSPAFHAEERAFRESGIRDITLASFQRKLRDALQQVSR